THFKMCITPHENYNMVGNTELGLFRHTYCFLRSGLTYFQHNFHWLIALQSNRITATQLLLISDTNKVGERWPNLQVVKQEAPFSIRLPRGPLHLLIRAETN